MRSFVCYFFFLLIPFLGWTQNPVSPAIIETENNLRKKLIQLRSEPVDELNDSINLEIINLFSGILNLEESFFYTWPGLDMIGKIQSDDLKVKIFTWNMQNKKGEHIYSGIIQQRIPRKREKDSILIHVLKDNSQNIKNPENQNLGSDNWLGALYYSVKDFSFRRQTYYVLLGFDFNNNFSNKKLIEILSLDGNKPAFGGEIQKETGIVRRLIFEYSSEIVMTLRFDQKLKKVVFDHLAPLEPMLQGVYRFYVPNGSYNALVFNKGKFTLVNDVDARNY